MADVNANIGVNIDTSDALNQLKNLQRQISQFHQSVAKSSSTAAVAQRDLQKNFVNSVNAIQGFSAELRTVRTSAESFTNSLEKNKFSMREYFRYAAGATQTFGRRFGAEFSTIEKTAIERVKTLQTQYIKMGRDAQGAMQAIAIRPTILNMQDLGTQTAITAQKQVLFNQLVKQGSTNLLNFGKNTQWAGRQLMVGFTLPLATLGMTAGRVFMDMEKAAIKFKKVYGDLFTAPEETQKAMDAVTELGLAYTKYGVAVSDSLSVAADAAAAGFQGVDLQNQTTASLKLSVLGQMELQKALETTIALQNAFRISSEDLVSTIDFLNAVENQTVVSLDDITEATPRVATVIQSLGGDVKDLAFFLAAMKEGGVNAAQGANALKSGLASLINPTERASEFLAGLGVNIRAIVSENQGDLRATVLGFARALDQLDPMRRAQAIEQLFGKFQFARISALFDNVIREGSQASRVLDLAGSSVSDLATLSEKELGVQAESSMNKFTSAIERMKVALVPLGQLFLDIATPFIDFGTKVLDAFNALPDGIRQTIGTVITVVGGLGPVLLMLFGLINNGIANMIKFFATVRLGYLKMTGQAKGIGDETQYMTQEQLEASAAAASLDQAHSNLTQRFTAEKVAVDALRDAYTQAVAAGNRFALLNPGMMKPGANPTKMAKGGVVTVGGRGNRDTEPALLTPGEAVIPADMVKKYQPLIQGMIAGNIPGYANGVMLGMPKSAKSVSKSRQAADEIYQMFLKSSYANTAPTEYGHQISPTSGHSFPIFGLGGVYQKGNKQVFVKPVLDEKAALAEMRSTEISRRAHGLEAPQQRIVVIRDPLDTTRQRRFLALESDLDPKFVNNQPMGLFNEEQYFRQLVASLLRVDKDLSGANVYGNVVADAGPAGVFSRASGLRDYERNLPSMEEQAIINLLGIKGGAKRAFAESTLGLMAGLTPEQYRQRMLGEIQTVLPKLKETIASFKLTNPTEVGVYDDMIRRLEQGLGVDWSKFHAIHSAVKPAKPKVKTQTIPGFNNGIVSVPGPKGAGDVVAAMLSPGEAVIPAEMAKKYAPIIQGMIAGNIPGYQNGRGGAANFGAGQIQIANKASARALEIYYNKLLQLNNSTDEVNRMFAELVAAAEKNKDGLVILTRAQAEEAAAANENIKTSKRSDLQLGHLQGTTRILPSGQRETGSFVRAMTPTQNKKLDQGGQAVDEFSTEWFKAGDALVDTVKLGGAEITAGIAKATAEIDREIHDIAVATAENGKITDEILARAADQALANAKARGGDSATAATALEKTKSMTVVKQATVETLKNSQALKDTGIEFGNATYQQIITKLESEGFLKAVTTSGGRTDYVATEKGAAFSAQGAGGRVARTRSSGEVVPAERFASGKSYLDIKEKTAKLVAEVRNEIGNELDKASRAKSPSEKTIKATKNMVDGVTETLVNSKDDVARAAETMVSPVTGKGRGPRRASSNPEIMAALAANQAQPVTQATRSSRRAYSSGMAPRSPGERGFIGPLMQDPNTIVETNNKLSNFGDTISKVAIGLSSITGILFMFGGEMSAIAGTISLATGAIFALIQITDALRSLQLVELARARYQAVADAIKLATTAAASAGLGVFATVTSVASAALTALLGPVGLIALGVAAAAAALIGLGFIIKGQMDKLDAFGKIVDVTADQIKFLGERAGEVPVLETGFDTATASSLEEVNTAAAKQRAEDEEFQTQFATQIQGAKDGAKKSVEDALNFLAFQLSSSGLSDKVVSETIAGIIRASKRTDIQFDFASVGISPENTDALVNNFKAQAEKVGSIDFGGNVAKSLTSLTKSFALQLQGEQIGLEEYTRQLGILRESIGLIENQTVRGNVINAAVDSLISDEGLREQIKSVKDLDKRFLLLQASGSATGLVMDDLVEMAKRNTVGNDALSRAIQEKTAAQIESNKVSQKDIDLGEITEEAQGILDTEITSINNKITAYGLLTKAGYDTKTALELLNNETLVGQIVQQGSVDGIKTNIDDLLEARKKLDTITGSAGGGVAQKSPFQQAIEKLQEQRKEIKNNIVAFAKLRKSGFGVSEAAELAADSLTAAALASQKIGSEGYDRLLRKIKQVKKAQDELLRSTPQGATQLFNEASDKVSAYFDSQEALLRAQTDAATATNRTLIENLELQIEGYNRQIGVFERDLDKIADKEDQINKAYDEKVKALEAVKKLNQDIINQQKSQLSIADALSRGDISAAASAMQESRAQSAAAQGDATATALEAARQGQLRSVTENGLTREQIEGRIKTLKQQISTIEFGSLQNARDAVDAAERALEKAVSTLTYRERTKAQWDLEAAAVDAAEKKTLAYEKGVFKALKTAKDLVKQWQSLDRTFTTTHVINTVSNDKNNNRVVPQARSNGGMIVKRFASGGMAMGTDTVPAMLTPGEFVVNRAATKKFKPILKSINDGSISSLLASGFNKPAYNMPQRGDLGSSIISYSSPTFAASPTAVDNSVYNYSLSVNVEGTDASANDIANVVMNKIRNMQSQQVRRQVLR